MRWPFVLRRRYDDELAAAKEQVNRLRRRAENAETAAKAELGARRTVVEQNAVLDAACRRLAGRNRALTEQLEAAQVGAGFDRARAVAAANRIAQAPRAVARARADVAESAPEKGTDS
ncbi:hypothetical protein ACFYOF_16630 [Streptomyces sp. NPDC007148]|uniref:hypothetical protein n=1 Tax=Streptomyces sp. NPDC007148 TaxID=3364775 RepID=UPI00369DC17E